MSKEKTKQLHKDVAPFAKSDQKEKYYADLSIQFHRF